MSCATNRVNVRRIATARHRSFHMPNRSPEAIIGHDTTQLQICEAELIFSSTLTDRQPWHPSLPYINWWIVRACHHSFPTNRTMNNTTMTAVAVAVMMTLLSLASGARTARFNATRINNLGSGKEIYKTNIQHKMSHIHLILILPHVYSVLQNYWVRGWSCAICGNKFATKCKSTKGYTGLDFKACM